MLRLSGKMPIKIEYFQIHMLRFTFLITACFFAAFSFCSPARALQTTLVYPGESWQKAKSPELLGWSSEKLAAARVYSKQIGSAAVVIVEDGIVLDAWGEFARKYQIHSMRKPLMSALIGIRTST